MKPAFTGLALLAAALAIGCRPAAPLQLSQEEKAKISAATAIDMTKAVWKAKPAEPAGGGTNAQSAEGSAEHRRTHEQELQDRPLRGPQSANGQAGIPDSQTKVTYCYWCPNCDFRGCVRWPDNKDRPLHAACPQCGFSKMVPLDSKGKALPQPKASTSKRQATNYQQSGVFASSSC